MGFVFSSRVWVLALLGACSLGAGAQSSITINTPATPLLPQSFGDWKQSAASPSTPPAAVSLANANKQALEEAAPERSAVGDYTDGKGRSLHLEAIQFGDRTGALSAYTLVRRADMREGKQIGEVSAAGQGAVLFYAGATLVLAYPATAADIAGLQPLLLVLPKPTGNKNIAPLLPTFLPAEGLIPASVRYALGPATYAAQGGVLPASSVGWDKSAEAITASYSDKRGKETLTILAYPTPEIAGAHMRSAQSLLAGMGPSFGTARVRRERELVLIANGGFPAEQAQKMVDNIHMHQQLSFDKDVQPVFQTEVKKTFSLFNSILIFCGLGAVAAILLGLFLGGGRALIRTLRGKPPATELEFLSLHLEPENKPAQFGPHLS